MGYNLKTNYFDLAELEKGGIATISSIFRPSRFDFKLARLGEVETRLANFEDHTTTLMDPFSPTVGSSKRSRAPSSGQMVSCLVDGCKADLSKCRDYHRRHKVCEMHSKTPRVRIGGHEQRFCQQCSRFHSLGEFDEGKRSCRKRLEGHNRRRRKPQPEPLPVNHGNFLSASQGGRYLGFSNQPIIPASSVVTTAWSGAVKSESNPTIYSSSSVSSSYSHAYGGRQFPFLQVPPESPLSGISETGVLNQVLDSDRALSLLSSSTPETPEMGLGLIIHHSSPINHTRPMISGLHYNSLSSEYPVSSQAHGLEGSGLFSDIRSNTILCQDVSRNDTDAHLASGGHQTISFSWE